MKNFQIPAFNPNEPIAQTDYYKWIVEQNITDIHSINTKVSYLTSLGFKKGIDKVSSDYLGFLKAIETMYFQWSVKPLLNIDLYGIIKNANKFGGITFNLKGEQPKNGYIVALPMSETIFESLDRNTLFNYIFTHKDLVQNNYFGIWVKNGKYYLDLSENIQSKEEAIYRGILRCQKAIFDCNEGKDISLPKGQSTGTATQRKAYARLLTSKLIG
jgi:hypothetical protein